MQVSIDISLYPLKEEFKQPIKTFINKMVCQDKFKVKRNNLSTSMFGEYKDLMQWITDHMEESFLENENAVFVLKVVGGNYYRD